MTRTCLALQHVSFEDLGTLGDVLRESGFDIQYRQAGVDNLASAQAQAEWVQADLVVVLGGPIGVYEADRYPFIHDELARVRERLTSGKPLIGICLGAQMMAAASGKAVYPGPAKEIGFKPLLLSEAGQASPLKSCTGMATPLTCLRAPRCWLPPMWWPIRCTASGLACWACNAIWKRNRVIWRNG